MITIDFEEDNAPKKGNGEDEVLHNKKLKPVYMSEERIAKLKSQYDCVCVNEFGDDYHLSEEERRENNKFYDAFKKFSKYKHKYRKLPEYIDAMREALKCLDFVADRNGFYDPEEFKRKVANKKIVVTGLQFPKYTGKDRKKLDWKYINEYILEGGDSKLVFGSLVNDDDDFEITLSEDEREIVSVPESEDEMNDEYEFAITYDLDEIVGKNVIVQLTGKDRKKFLKEHPEVLASIKQLKEDERRDRDMATMAYQFLTDDLNNIDVYNKNSDVKISKDMPVFKGNLSKKSDFDRYMRQLDEYEETEIKIKGDNGRYVSDEEIEASEIREMLDRNGYNLRAFYGNKEKEKKLKKLEKESKKREAELKRRLTKIQERRNRKFGKDGEKYKTLSDAKKKSKKKKKASKKKKESSKKFETLINNLHNDFGDRVTDFTWAPDDK